MSLRLAPAVPRAAFVLAGLCALAGFARADEITVHLTGKVTTVEAGVANPDAVAQLAAHGVQVGSSAAVTLSYESTAPGVLVQLPFECMQYDHAITDLSISVGSWSVDFVGGAVVTVNFVQVGNDVPTPGAPQFKFDSWTGVAEGQDTDGILSNGPVIDYGTSLIGFTQVPPKASKDNGLVQDFDKYTNDRYLTFAGGGGEISIDLGSVGGGGSTADPAALAREGQLRAAAKLGQSLLKGLGKLAAAPLEKDPFGTLYDALLQDTSDSFGTKFVAAVTKALKKGGSAPLGESDEGAATDFLMDGLLAQSNPLTTGEDKNDPADRVLRGKLLKALAAECKADFLAHAADVKKPDAAKLAGKLAKSRAALAKQVEKALDKASAAGVAYAGPDAEAISDALTDFVDGFVSLTETGVK